MNGFINSETDVLLHKWENPRKQCFARIHRAREGMPNVHPCVYDGNSCYLNSVPECEALERGGLVFIFLLQKQSLGACLLPFNEFSYFIPS